MNIEEFNRKSGFGAQAITLCLNFVDLKWD